MTDLTTSEKRLQRLKEATIRANTLAVDLSKRLNIYPHIAHAAIFNKKHLNAERAREPGSQAPLSLDALALTMQKHYDAQHPNAKYYQSPT